MFFHSVAVGNVCIYYRIRSIFTRNNQAFLCPPGPRCHLSLPFRVIRSRGLGKLASSTANSIFVSSFSFCYFEEYPRFSSPRPKIGIYTCKRQVLCLSCPSCTHSQKHSFQVKYLIRREAWFRDDGYTDRQTHRQTDRQYYYLGPSRLV